MNDQERLSEREDSEPASAPPAEPTAVAPTGLVAGPLRMSITGLLVGLVTWQVVHWTFPFFMVPDVPVANVQSPTQEEQERMEFAGLSTTRKDAAAVGLIAGGLAALLFALVEGISQGRAGRAVAITGVSIFLGACLGAVGGYCSTTFQWTYRHDPSLMPMKRELGIQGIFWLAIAAGVGLGMAMYARRVGVMLCIVLQTILGAVLFVIVYVPLASLAFPSDNAESTVPYSSANIAAWALLAFGIMGLMLGLSRARPRKKVESSA